MALLAKILYSREMDGEMMLVAEKKQKYFVIKECFGNLILGTVVGLVGGSLINCYMV